MLQRINDHFRDKCAFIEIVKRMEPKDALIVGACSKVFQKMLNCDKLRQYWENQVNICFESYKDSFKLLPNDKTSWKYIFCFIASMNHNKSTCEEKIFNMLYMDMKNEKEKNFSGNQQIVGSRQEKLALLIAGHKICVNKGWDLRIQLRECLEVFKEELNTPGQHQEAQYLYGSCFAMEDPMDANPEYDQKAFKYLKLSADGGHSLAQKKLGDLYTKFYSGSLCHLISLVSLDLNCRVVACMRYISLANYGGLNLTENQIQDLYSKVYRGPVNNPSLDDVKVVCREQAYKYYVLSVENGCSSAFVALGTYDLKHFQDPITGFQWFQSAANMGDASGQLMLGRCYRDGVGVEPNLLEAKKYLQLSADQGNWGAHKDLGELYFDMLKSGRNPSSLGIDVDSQEEVAAVFSACNAAAEDSNCIEVKATLAYFHELGVGVSANMAKAYECYCRAIRLGKEYLICKVDISQPVEDVVSRANLGDKDAIDYLVAYDALKLLRESFESIESKPDLERAFKNYKLLAKPYDIRSLIGRKQPD